jgi:hypothetical protein
MVIVTIQADREYEQIVEEGRLIGLRRFDPKHKVWIELRFDEKTDRKIEEDFVSILTSEYIRQQSEE